MSTILLIKAFRFDLLFPSEISEFVGVEGTELLKDFHHADANKIADGAVRAGGSYDLIRDFDKIKNVEYK